MRLGALFGMVCLLAACGSSTNTGRDGGAPDGGVSSDASTDAGVNRDAGSQDAGANRDAGVNDGGTTTPDGGPGGPSMGGCPLFPPDYAYNQDISAAPLDSNSATYISNLSSRAGSIVAEYPGGEYLNIVPASQPDVPIGTTAEYGFDTSDTFYYHQGSAVSGATAPVPSGAVYENMTNPSSDHHLMILQQGTCRLFEFYSWNPSSATSGWESVVTWNLMDNEQLPDGYGSTTAAGTPLVPGVIWYSEVSSGEIQHAVDIVIPGAALAKYEYVQPAARSGGACGSNYPTDGFPYGGRLRLKADYDTSSYTGTEALVVIRALQKYGMIVTDDSGESRSSFRLGDGTMLDRTDIQQLNQLTWNDFEVPQMAVVHSTACN